MTVSLVGLVVVSHSRALADAAVELAMQMVADSAPPISVAAGMPDGGLGTDATAVMDAMLEADAGAGVVVLMDLGSALMSTEMAVELLDDTAPDHRVVAAPFVEGLIAAAVMAAGGAALDDVANEAVRALHPKLQALGENDSAPPQPAADDKADDWSPDSSAEVTLPNLAGLHARPAAMLAGAASGFDAQIRVLHPRGGFAPATSPIGLATLDARHGDVLRIEARGSEAEAAVQEIVALVEEGFGETRSEPQPGASAPSSPLGVSPGRVIGPVHKVTARMSAPLEAPEVTGQEIEVEVERLAGALESVIADYRDRAEHCPPQAADILRATAGLVGDPTLRDAAVDVIRNQGMDSASAFWRAANSVAQTMKDAGGLLAERAVDLTDIRDRVVSRLLGIPLPGVVDPGHPFILVARDLAPSETATLNGETCLAIVTAEGGPTSHTSILARGMGIPAVVGCTQALDIADGTVILVDGNVGEVIVEPNDEERATARTSRPPMEPLTAPGTTADGLHVSLLANVGSSGDAQSAAAAGAEGIGLFRTEFCFLDRGGEPSIREQVQSYADAVRSFPDARVVVRTLDAGSDKPMAFLPMPDEPNPALGIRGYRTARTHPDMLERQLRAIVEASSDCSAAVWVMAPMISTAEEAREFAALARGCGVETVGVMIETPSAALQSAEILSEVDFVSVGTNDLTQYAMAVDRQAVGLGDLQDAWQPGVLRLLRSVGEAGRTAGKPVGVCGEAASDPALAPVLIGMGVTSLSMSPRVLRGVADALSGVTIEQCREAARAATAAVSAHAARRAAAKALT